MSDRTPQRRTRQRAAINDIIADLSDFRTAQEIHDELRHAGQPIGLATVYRTLQAMTETGEVDTVRTPDGQASYRRCSTGHHHHLICRSCGRAVEIQVPDFERWARGLAIEHGFTDIDHEVELYGLCETCHATETRPSPTTSGT